MKRIIAALALITLAVCLLAACGVLAVFVRTDGPLAMETVPQEAE